MRPPLGICWGSLAKTSVSELIQIAGANGFSAITPLPDDEPPASTAIRRLLDQNRITRVVLDGVLGMLPRCRFAVENGITAERHFHHAEIYHATHFNVPHYQGDPNTPVGDFVEALKPFCERAARKSIVVCLEFLPGSGIPDMPRALEIIDKTAAPNLGLTLDTWHMARTGASIADVRALPKGIIREFQISDRDANESVETESFGRLLPGEGAQPLTEIIQAVLENAPDLALSAEVFARELHDVLPEEAASRVAHALRRVLTQAGYPQ